MKVGKIYAEIARGYFAEQYTGSILEENREALLLNGSFGDVDKELRLKSSIEDTIQALHDALYEHTQSCLPANFSEIVLFSQANNIEYISALISKLEEDEKGQIVVKMLEAVHNRWIISNPKKFFQKKCLDEQFRFMPIQLIGYEEAKKDFVIVRPILKAIGLWPRSERYIRRAFRQEEYRFLKETYQIFSLEKLEDFIKYGEATKLAGNIRDILRSDESTRRRIAEQLLANNPNLL